jgi:hypothetical protein
MGEAVIDMMFIHTLESAILAALSRAQSQKATVENNASPLTDLSPDCVSKKIAHELYFCLDASLLIDLAMHKLNENYSSKAA